jgi:glutathione S-transferase
MSDEFDSLDEREKAAVEGALNRCRGLAAKIENELCNRKPEHFGEKLVLAEFCAALKRAADALGQTGQKSHPAVKDSQARGRRR